eukprot:scaffold215314_cov28-Attheya_sp.AAC.2
MDTHRPAIQSHHRPLLTRIIRELINCNKQHIRFSPPPSMLCPTQQQDITMQQVQHNGQQLHLHEYGGNANMEHSPSRGASN